MLSLTPSNAVENRPPHSPPETNLEGSSWRLWQEEKWSSTNNETKAQLEVLLEAVGIKVLECCERAVHARKCLL